MRRIILLKRNDSLQRAWETRSFAPALDAAGAGAKVKGFELEPKVFPIPVFGRRSDTQALSPHVEYGSRALQGTPSEVAYAMVGHFDDQDAVERLKSEKGDNVIGVYADPEILPAPVYCQASGEGDYQDVRKALGVTKLRAAGLQGKGVRIAVMDTGIHGAHPAPDGKPIQGRIVYGYRPGMAAGSYRGGSSAINHGTMVAFDSLLGAPAAQILDYAIIPATGEAWQAFLSDALAAVADLLEYFKKKPGPLVVNNSWALFDRRDDAPAGSAENYSANGDHPFNQIVGALVDAGADVLFAAGNCGKECPDGRCGKQDKGQGNSIHGANSHPKVITVAAVTVKKVRLGYSSQGPGGLNNRKPDLAAFSHFAGSGVYKADGGTSAASPVAAGIVAALRQALPKLSPGEMKAILQRTATAVGSAWNYDTGYGIIDGYKALQAAKSAKPVKSLQASKTAAKKRPHEPAWMQQPTTAEERAAHVMRLRAAAK